MKKTNIIFCFITLILFSLSAYGGIKNMYIQRTGDDGSVFFIFKQNLPALNETNKIIKKISYDYTYLQQNDSVAMLVTLKLPKLIKDISMTICYNDTEFHGDTELIYVDAKGKSYEYRLRITMPFGVFENMYSSNTPFRIRFNGKTENENSILEFGYRNKEWLKNRQKMSAIISLIKLNTHKE